jgi:hypothetical protein
VHFIPRQAKTSQIFTQPVGVVRLLLLFPRHGKQPTALLAASVRSICSIWLFKVLLRVPKPDLRKEIERCACSPISVRE